MAPTVTRLILSFALLVATPVLYILGMFVVFEASFFYFDEDTVFKLMTIATVVGFGVGWWLIWMGEVRWSPARRWGTVVVVAGSFIGAGLVGFLMVQMMPYGEVEVAMIFGGMVWVVLWLFGTAIAWRETKGERAERLKKMGVGALPCPGCGYNLSGLKESRCPECGAGYTLDSLYAAMNEQQRALGE